MLLDVSELLGVKESELVPILGQRLRAEVIPAVEQLQVDAAAAGFQLAIASGYRSFTRQQRIWDEKADGRRPLLDDAGHPLSCDQLTLEQRLFAILRWSALPGASRHHWGTDFDVFDSGALKEGQSVQLTVEETLGDGPFAPFHRWLDQHLQQTDNPFFRPYTQSTGGIAPERWHLSYAPLAARIQPLLNLDTLSKIIQTSDIALKEEVISHLPYIFERYVWVPWSQYPERFRNQYSS
jgi:LAS superfamily LD-carboxypeptidase LdcB